MNQRDIKFRGKSYLTDKFCYGFLTQKQSGTYHIGFHNKNDVYEHELVRNETVGQFTGLKDKNGIEIFEGDLFEVLLEDYGNGNITKVVGEVVFSHGCFIIEYSEPYAGEHRNTMLYIFLYKNHSIIGNIHQNPELL